MKAYWKDIFRTIKLEKKRFFSILLITFLGVTMFAGLSAGCRDLRASADRFYDEQKLYDIKIQSTFGLTDEDVEALSQVKEVAKHMELTVRPFWYRRMICNRRQM